MDNIEALSLQHLTRRPLDRSDNVTSDVSVSHQDVFTKAANGDTAGSYFTDGRYHIGGWSTYPSEDELALSTGARPVTATQENVRQINPR